MQGHPRTSRGRYSGEVEDFTGEIGRGESLQEERKTLSVPIPSVKYWRREWNINFSKGDNFVDEVADSLYLS